MGDPAGPLLAMLWDADGVLQHLTEGLPDWEERLEAIGGPGFPEAVFRAEAPAMSGREPMRDALARVLRDHPRATTTVEDLLALWETFEVDDEAIAVIGELRRTGVRCYLATNQHDHRTAYMRRTHAYDAWFDGVFYSNEVGAAKPSTRYFERVLAGVSRDLGAAAVDPRRVGFVDDLPENVAGAAALGIRAVRHDPASGAEGLRSDLARIGVGLPEAARPAGPRTSD